MATKVAQFPRFAPNFNGEVKKLPYRAPRPSLPDIRFYTERNTDSDLGGWTVDIENGNCTAKPSGF